MKQNMFTPINHGINKSKKSANNQSIRIIQQALLNKAYSGGVV